MISQERKNLFLYLSMMTAFSVNLVILRFIITETIFYGFLVWNIFLAGIPLLISSYLLYKYEEISAIKRSILLIFWLLFLPNSPYILTDLFHLHNSLAMPIWYDILLISSFSLTGVFMFLISLMDIHRILNKLFTKRTSDLMIIISIILTGLGIYIGRYLRWNSWDIIVNPIELIKDIAYSFIHSSRQLRIIGMTLGYGTFLSLAYYLFRELINHKAD